MIGPGVAVPANTEVGQEVVFSANDAANAIQGEEAFESDGMYMEDESHDEDADDDDDEYVDEEEESGDEEDDDDEYLDEDEEDEDEVRDQCHR